MLMVGAIIQDACLFQILSKGLNLKIFSSHKVYDTQNMENIFVPL